ncbi:MAG: hypothetical protein Q7R39_19795 [Dehalococcoidia bacterium]|nr:hypothetical protein [Dehalococcoidia bacterium]
MDELAKYSPLVSILVGLVTIGVILFSVGRWFQRLETRMDRFDNKLQILNSWASGFSKEINTFFGTIVQLLSNRKELTTAELGLVTKGLSNLNASAVATLFDQEHVSHNPLTPPDLERLEGYYRRAQAGGTFNAGEVTDYNRLVAVLERERSGDPGVWPLVALGAFLLGIILATPKEGEDATSR